MPAKITAPRGTKDVLPAEIFKWREVESAAIRTAGLFGYGEIRFPAFEHTELFLRGVGDTTDIVQKEMYTFEDKGGRSITLRPEGTASVVRAMIESSLIREGLPVKVFYIAPNFRYEKPQAGRLREHHQFGVECFGPAGAEADVELIELGKFYLASLGITRVALKINSIGCPVCRAEYNRALLAYLEGKKDGLCGLCLDRMGRNPLRVLDCKVESCAGIVAGAPKMTDYLCPDCGQHFEEVRTGLDRIGIKYEVDPKIVRGLDYYTRTVFEFVSDAIGAQAALIAGGRYDGLVEQLGGQPTPGLGFGSGIERVQLVMEAEGRFGQAAEGCDLFVAVADESAAGRAALLVSELRGMGVRAERDVMGRGLKAQMKYADRIGAKNAVTLGGNELESGLCRLRDMAAHGERECPVDAGAIAALIITA